MTPRPRNARDPTESVVPTRDASGGSKLGTTENTDALDRKVTTMIWPNGPLMVTGLVMLGGSSGA